MTTSGEGTARLDQLTGGEVSASLSGSGSILLTATRSLEASLSGAGPIVYRGSPSHLVKSVTGTGTISGT